MEENKIKLTALKTTTNIYVLIKDLYHQLPYYKANISLSWKSISSGGKVVTNGMEKCHPPITFEFISYKSGSSVHRPGKSTVSVQDSTLEEKTSMSKALANTLVEAHLTEVASEADEGFLGLLSDLDNLDDPT